MSQLLEIQEQFQNYMLNRDRLIEQYVAEGENTQREERLSVYGDGYYFRFDEVLSDDYPMFAKLLGVDDFYDLCCEYVNAYPSTHFAIRYLGRHLAKFVAGMDNVNPLWPELVKFEWALCNALDSKDSPILTLEHMATIPPQSLADAVFVPHPSLIRLQLHSNVVSLWQALDKDQELPPFEQLPQSSEWIIWRKDRLAYFVSLTEQERWMLNALIEGHSFGAICEGLAQWYDEEEAAQFAASVLRVFITDHLLSDIQLCEV